MSICIGDEHERQGHDLRDAVEKRDAAGQGEHEEKEPEGAFVQLLHQPVERDRFGLRVLRQFREAAGDRDGFVGRRHPAGSPSRTGRGPVVPHPVAKAAPAFQREIDDAARTCRAGFAGRTKNG
jgi:hypothetical protein